MATPEEIKTHVFDQGMKRWRLPDGMTQGALIADLKEDLRKFTADIIREAFNEVRRNHTYPTWPQPGEFYRACNAIKSENPDIDPNCVEVMKRSKEAHSYAQSFCNGQSLNKYAKICHGNGTITSLYNFVFEKACLSLRSYGRPNINDWKAELEQEMAAWDKAVQEWKAKNPTPPHVKEQFTLMIQQLRRKEA